MGTIAEDLASASSAPSSLTAPTSAAAAPSDSDEKRRPRKTELRPCDPLNDRTAAEIGDLPPPPPPPQVEGRRRGGRWRSRPWAEELDKSFNIGGDGRPPAGASPPAGRCYKTLAKPNLCRTRLHFRTTTDGNTVMEFGSPSDGPFCVPFFANCFISQL